MGVVACVCDSLYDSPTHGCTLLIHGPSAPTHSPTTYTPLLLQTIHQIHPSVNETFFNVWSMLWRLLILKNGRNFHFWNVPFSGSVKCHLTLTGYLPHWAVQLMQCDTIQNTRLLSRNISYLIGVISVPAANVGMRSLMLWLTSHSKAYGDCDKKNILN